MSGAEDPSADSGSTTSAMYFVVSNRANGVQGYTWKIAWHGTSFYVTPTYAPLSEMKISMHGPDAHHTTSAFSLSLVEQATPRAVKAGRGRLVMGDWGPRGWFPGEEVQPGVRRVVRLRNDFGMFMDGVPSGPTPRAKTAADRSAYRAASPPIPFSTDLDLYLSDGTPYWPDEKQARRDNAALGPLQNKAGQSLTGVVVRRSLITTPTPSPAMGPAPQRTSDRVRGVGAACDEAGLLWIVEQWLDATRLIERD